ncbi:MAG: bifunctional diaminohydroxyphosphoribosylaminopyrimidine deaminase/5-amino-6-(5-phosphoribosylamino)uracil reductase RibD [Saprospirales bacterium]|nr:MAG: bifunctional diaminohydroxyphosphoribosylaminopyrimidine deaminase/5-amino-6-(5-phosphoribosylamino)uracil reductase RibD [Saprospirales bacterium]
MNTEMWMRRCFDLASLGRGRTHLNPPVGAVITCENRIIGEGWHKGFGKPHAEVEAIRSVKSEDLHLLSKSTIYVSLEPCSYHGKTPPCSQLIIDHQIPHVVVSVRDPNPKVAGNGIAQLKAAGIKITEGVLEKEGKALIRTFSRNQLSGRPRITLKFACSADGFVGKIDQRTPLSNAVSNQLVHRLRTESDAIAIGRKTAAIDNPQLTTRNYPGKNPLRLVFSRTGVLDEQLKIFDHSAPTVLVTPEKNKEATELLPNGHSRLSTSTTLTQTAEQIYQTLQTGSLLLEGGPELMSEFIEEGCWDEIIKIVCPVALQEGVKAPDLRGLAPSFQYFVGADVWVHYLRRSD